MPRLLTKITITLPVESDNPWKGLKAAEPLRLKLDELEQFVHASGGAYKEDAEWRSFSRKQGDPEPAAPELPMPPSCSIEPPPSQVPSRDSLLDIPPELRRPRPGESAL